MKSQRTAVALIGISLSAHAMSQELVSELVKQGAVKLDKAQLTSVLTGTTVSGPRPQGGTDLIMQLKNDGSFASTAADGKPVSGTWKVQDDGQMCVQATTNTCGTWYKLGDKYFVAVGEQNATAKAFPRTVKK